MKLKQASRLTVGVLGALRPHPTTADHSQAAAPQARAALQHASETGMVWPDPAPAPTPPTLHAQTHIFPLFDRNLVLPLFIFLSR